MRMILAVTMAMFVCPAFAQKPIAEDNLAPPTNVEPAARAIIESFFAAQAKVKDTTYLLNKTERMRDGEVVVEQLFVKLRPKPYAVYLARTKPKRGMEALYVGRGKGSKMTGHTGSFPDITLNLDPHGSLAMKDQHHPIYATGMHGMVRRLEKALKLAEASKVKVSKSADQTVGGITAHCVLVDATGVKGRQVKAKDDETLYALANRVGSWPYIIYAHNNAIDDLDDDLDEGQKVFIPTYYAVRSEFCFDPATSLPVRELFRSKQGVYEQYDTLDRILNTGLAANDFDPENKAYNF